ncbi:MAG: hypothetical protein NC342_08305 [Pseudoflavonifractor sp.]|nr:hypothetical protein [Alloprevotella sp.]MCM1117522.1 hypothetical protein [Pseudoflavonifractor sp.]
MNDNIVTFRTYSTLADAYIALGILRNHEIAASVTNTLSTLYAPIPTDGYSLQVFERDLPRVSSILDKPME